MRRGRVTGWAPARGPFGAISTMPLYDGAEAVPSVEAFTHEALTRYVTYDGRLMFTVCCCGPEAPLPGKYSETVERLRDGVQWYVIREHTIEGRVRTFTRLYHEHEVEAVGIDTMWRGVRAQYARQTGAAS